MKDVRNTVILAVLGVVLLLTLTIVLNNTGAEKSRKSMEAKVNKIVDSKGMFNSFKLTNVLTKEEFKAFREEYDLIPEGNIPPISESSLRNIPPMVCMGLRNILGKKILLYRQLEKIPKACGFTFSFPDK